MSISNYNDDACAEMRCFNVGPGSLNHRNQNELGI